MLYCDQSWAITSGRRKFAGHGNAGNLRILPVRQRGIQALPALNRIAAAIDLFQPDGDRIPDNFNSIGL
jgi:hypothetical protein